MSEPVPFFSAQRIHEGFDALAAVRRVLDRHWYVLGDEVKAFERDFAAYCGVAHCISLANGTDALELALRALGIGPGDPVVLAGNAGYYGATAVALVGARPCFVDIDARTLTLSPQALQQALAQGLRPKAVLVTHLYGQLADIEALSTLCSQNGIALVEDCAQAHGARRGGQLAGSWGDIACFSFYPTKNLGALGDGGAVATGREDLAQRVRALRQYGWSQKYHNTLALGRNSRLDEIQAAVLNDKLPLLDAANQARQALAARYKRGLPGSAAHLALFGRRRLCGPPVRGAHARARRASCPSDSRRDCHRCALPRARLPASRLPGRFGHSATASDRASLRDGAVAAVLSRHAQVGC
jgi:aminotransferase EvaB